MRLLVAMLAIGLAPTCGSPSDPPPKTDAQPAPEDADAEQAEPPAEASPAPSTPEPPAEASPEPPDDDDDATPEPEPDDEATDPTNDEPEPRDPAPAKRKTTASSLDDTKGMHEADVQRRFGKPDERRAGRWIYRLPKGSSCVEVRIVYTLTLRDDVVTKVDRTRERTGRHCRRRF